MRRKRCVRSQLLAARRGRGRACEQSHPHPQWASTLCPQAHQPCHSHVVTRCHTPVPDLASASLFSVGHGQCGSQDLRLSLRPPSHSPSTCSSSWASVHTHLAMPSPLVQHPAHLSVTPASPAFNTSCAWRSHQPPPLSPLSVPSNALLPWNAPSACLFTNPPPSTYLHAVYNASQNSPYLFCLTSSPYTRSHKVCSDQRPVASLVSVSVHRPPLVTHSCHSSIPKSSPLSPNPMSHFPQADIYGVQARRVLPTFLCRAAQTKQALNHSLVRFVRPFVLARTEKNHNPPHPSHGDIPPSISCIITPCLDRNPALAAFDTLTPCCITYRILQSD